MLPLNTMALTFRIERVKDSVEAEELAMSSEFGYVGEILRADLSSGEMAHLPTRDYADRCLEDRSIWVSGIMTRRHEAQGPLSYCNPSDQGLAPEAISGLNWGGVLGGQVLAVART